MSITDPEEDLIPCLLAVCWWDNSASLSTIYGLIIRDPHFIIDLCKRLDSLKEEYGAQ